MPSKKDHGGSDEEKVSPLYSFINTLLSLLVQGYGNDGDTLPSLTSTVKQAKKTIETEASKIQGEASKVKERL
ncbi:hypothetical protein COL26b_014444, partial [Colletotrichum chrysophilum]|uniref:uncharacterized protein n=1 Tax=Colletotrichum chrysophilum TaxID=1836956 RepID=UPI00230008F2